MAPQQQDTIFMRRALSLARRGVGRVSPNPAVGAILVSRGKIIGEGWHQKAGQAHAEIRALEQAKKHGKSSRGATMYVTLEPCSTHGRTPPCTKALIRAGVKRVVVACLDPNPSHEGRGLKHLRAAGISVQTGIGRLPAERLNAAFFQWIRTKCPRVTLKAAMTLDGKIATADGQSKWITGEVARRHAMRLRHSMDAILVGRQTVEADDPSLTVRLSSSAHSIRKPLMRIVLDSRARIPLGAKVLNDDMKHMTRVVVSASAPAGRLAALQKRVEVWQSPAKTRVDLFWLVQTLGCHEVTSLLVEGGGEVHASFLEAGLVDEVAFYYAPKVLGGTTSRRAIAGKGATQLSAALRLDQVRWRQLGMDLGLRALVVKNSL